VRDGEAEPEHELLGESRPIRELRKLLGKLAPTESPVLIRGESGTGKELVARTLHRQSQRHDQPFVAINCGAIPEHLIQSELFGHEKGAFTGAHQRKVGRIEAAHGGTLFLDEIGDLPLELQANLLRFLQEKHIERVGGTQPIPWMCGCWPRPTSTWKRPSSRAFPRRPVLPPQRVAGGDRAVARPAWRPVDAGQPFARFYSLETGRRPRSFSDHALAAMGRHDWPGNVRELANRVRRGLVLAEGRQIEAQDLGLHDQVAQEARWARWRTTSTAPSARPCAMCSTGTVTT
jgi:DNA-binding NtrC family response regulator